MNNLFPQFNASRPAQVGVSHYPWIAGWRGRIHQETSGRVWAVVEHASASGKMRQWIGIVAADIATRAEAVEFDPYNDAAYAQYMIELARCGLIRAEQTQRTGQRKARDGGFDLYAL
jgi:hypothetical protein